MATAPTVQTAASDATAPSAPTVLAAPTAVTAPTARTGLTVATAPMPQTAAVAAVWPTAVTAPTVPTASTISTALARPSAPSAPTAPTAATAATAATAPTAPTGLTAATGPIVPTAVTAPITLPGITAHIAPTAATGPTVASAPIVASAASVMSDASTGDLRSELADLPSTLRRQLLRGRLQGWIGDALGYSDGEVPAVDMGFFDIGMTSIHLAEVRTRISATLGFEPDETTAFDYPTITEFADYLERSLDSAVTQPVSVPTSLPVLRAEDTSGGENMLTALDSAAIDDLSPVELERVLTAIL